jgi:probable F420-dependent oxidoreductase
VTALRPFRFGIQAPGGGDASGWKELARAAEDLGYDTLTMPDHFDRQLAPGPALATAAAVTTRLRIGTLVYGVDYRHPVTLAKEAATLDVVSDGRFELGLGAGWMRSDYDQAGLAYDPAGVRIERMVEFLGAVRALWGPGPVEVSGHHVSINGLDGQPKPIQKPGPPILVGGGGRRMLTTAATEADIVGVNFNLAGGVIGPDVGADATAERADEKVAWVRQAAGDRFEQLELHIRVFVASVTEDRRGLAETVSAGFGLTPEQALAAPFALAGTVSEICETLVERRERWGFSYTSLGPEVLHEFAPVVARLAGT